MRVGSRSIVAPWCISVYHPDGFTSLRAGVLACLDGTMVPNITSCYDNAAASAGL